MTNHFILDNVFSLEECLYIYNELLRFSSWTLMKASLASNDLDMQLNAFPGLIVEQDGKIHHEFLSGYFRSTIFRIKQILEKQHQFKLPQTINRIHIAAKNSHSQTKFHTDHRNNEAWTILGFLNPVWNAKDGGEFYLEDQKIDYKTARFVVFKSNIRHNGGYVVNETINYWRINVNVILLDKTES